MESMRRAWLISVRPSPATGYGCHVAVGQHEDGSRTENPIGRTLSAEMFAWLSEEGRDVLPQNRNGVWGFSYDHDRNDQWEGRGDR